MVEYDTKMAVPKSDPVSDGDAIIINTAPEIEERRGKFRVRINGKLYKFNTKEEAQKALKE
jgi:hypothetical protein|tara:strand:- start:657 stop:839 length:183 start_codon:yes stop_codon:yes gene_type:complete